MRQTAGVIEHKTFRQERMMGARQTQATQVFVIPECPSPRETHPRRESNEESPESRRLFGAVWGAQPQRTPRGKHSKANAVTQKRTLPRRLRSPRPFVSPSGSPPENAQARSEPTKPDDHATSENARMAIPTHGGIGTEHLASRPVWRSCGKQQA